MTLGEIDSICSILSLVVTLFLAHKVHLISKNISIKGDNNKASQQLIKGNNNQQNNNL